MRAENSEEAITADLQVCGLCDEAERHVERTNLYCERGSEGFQEVDSMSGSHVRRVCVAAVWTAVQRGSELQEIG